MKNELKFDYDGSDGHITDTIGHVDWHVAVHSDAHREQLIAAVRLLNGDDLPQGALITPDGWCLYGRTDIPSDSSIMAGAAPTKIDRIAAIVEE